MKFSKIPLFLAFCLSVFFAACRKDNANGKYIVKATAIGNNATISDFSLIVRDWKLTGTNEGYSSYSQDGDDLKTVESQVLESQGYLLAYAVAERKNSAKGRIGVKIEVFKIGDNGKRTKVSSVTKSSLVGFTSRDDAANDDRHYGASLKLPENEKKAIASEEELVALDNLWLQSVPRETRP